MEQFKLQASRAPAYHTQGRAPALLYLPCHKYNLYKGMFV